MSIVILELPMDPLGQSCIRPEGVAICRSLAVELTRELGYYMSTTAAGDALGLAAYHGRVELGILRGNRNFADLGDDGRLGPEAVQAVADFVRELNIVMPGLVGPTADVNVSLEDDRQLADLESRANSSEGE